MRVASRLTSKKQLQLFSPGSVASLMEMEHTAPSLTNQGRGLETSAPLMSQSNLTKILELFWGGLIKNLLNPQSPNQESSYIFVLMPFYHFIARLNPLFYCAAPPQSENSKSQQTLKNGIFFFGFGSRAEIFRWRVLNRNWNVIWAPTLKSFFFFSFDLSPTNNLMKKFSLMGQNFPNDFPPCVIVI